MKFSEQEALKLEGAELDAAVAELVMGWERGVGFTGSWITNGAATTLNQMVRISEFTPSTNIAQAYKAEEMVPEERMLDWHLALTQVVAMDEGSVIQTQIRCSRATPTQRCRAMLLWKIRGED